MTLNPFQAFIDLITFDKSVIALEQSIEQKQADIQAVEKNIEQLDAQLEASKQKYTSAKKNVDAHELVMKEFNQAESDYKKKLDTVQNQKEYKAVTTELEAVQAKQQEQEVVLLGAWNTFEQAEKLHKQKEDEINTQKAELEKQLKDATDALEAARKELAGTEQERASKTAGVNPEWLEKYAAMRARVSNPVVPVQSGMCTACFLSLPAQMIADLRHNKLLQCKQCYRFLYLEEPKPEAESEIKPAE